MGKVLKTLIIEDSENDTELLIGQLERGGYDPDYRRVDNALDLKKALKSQSWDIVFADHKMPGFDSITALSIVRTDSPDLPFLIVSGSIGEEVAVAAMRAGAQDYLMKNNLARLGAAVDRELRDADERRARRIAERALLAREEELRIAREVQQQLFPAASPATAGFDIAGASYPAEATGGDYFDFFPGSGGEIFAVVGDVTGHGLGPALLMAEVRAYVRALALPNRSIGDIMRQANHLLAEDFGSDRFVTLILTQLDPATNRLRYLNTGHPSGFVLAPDGHVKFELATNASALGLDPDTLFPEACELTLAKNDIVMLLTDGIMEATSEAGEEFGMSRALDIVHGAQSKPSIHIIQSLLSEIRKFAGKENINDDITAIIIKCQHDAAAH